jgi:hypothetical protein
MINNYTINDFKTDIKQLYNKHPFLSRIQYGTKLGTDNPDSLRYNKYILFPNLDETPELENQYTEWINNHPNSSMFKIIINDLINVGEQRDSISTYTNIRGPKLDLNFVQSLNINEDQYQKIINNLDRSKINGNIDRDINDNDFEKLLDDFLHNLKLAYNKYSFFGKNKKWYTIKEMTYMDHEQTILGINYKQKSELYNNYEIIKKTRNYQIEIYGLFDKHIVNIYNESINGNICSQMCYKGSGKCAYCRLKWEIRIKREEIDYPQQESENYELYKIIKEEEAFKFFKLCTERLLDKLYNEMKILNDTKRPKYDTIKDGDLMKQFLRIIYGIRLDKIDKKYENEINNNKINLHNKKSEVINQFIEIYKKNKGDIMPGQNILLNDDETQIYEVLMMDENNQKQEHLNLFNIDFNYELFKMHYIYPGIKTIIDNHKAGIMIFSPHNDQNEKKRPEYNILDDYIKKNNNNKDAYDLICVQLCDKQIPIYGLRSVSEPYYYNADKYSVYDSLDSKRMYCSFYNYLFWSDKMNSFKTYHYINESENDVKAILLFDKNKIPTRYSELMPEQVHKKKIEKILDRCIYFGYYRIPTGGYNPERHVWYEQKHDFILLLFWDNEKMEFFVSDFSGNELRMGTLTFNPTITYSELIQMMYYDVTLYKDPIITNLHYITKTKDEIVKFDSSYKKYKLCKERRSNYHAVNMTDFPIDYYEKVTSYYKYKLCPEFEHEQHMGSPLHIGYKTHQSSQQGGNIFFNIIKSDIDIKCNEILTTKYMSLYTNKRENEIYKYYTYEDISKYTKILNPYEYLYPKKRLFIEEGLVTGDKDKTIREKDVIKSLFPQSVLTLDLRKENILDYKIRTNGGLYFWEVNYQHKLIKQEHKEIYEINNHSSIHDVFFIINDLLFPNQKMKFISIDPDFLTSHQSVKTHHKKSMENREKNDDLINLFIEDKNEYDKTLDKIGTIDFLFLDFRLYINYNNFESHVPFDMIAYFYTFIKVCDKLAENSSICMRLGKTCNDLDVKILTLIGFMFDDYRFVKPELNMDNTKYMFLILTKYKKDNNYIKQLKNILDDNIFVLNNMGVIDNYGENPNLSTNEVVKLLKPLFDIELTNPKLESFYDKIRKDVIMFYDKCYFQFYYFLEKMDDMAQKDYKNQLTDEIIQTRKEKNLFECIQWSKKNKFPLMKIDDRETFEYAVRKNTLSDIISPDFYSIFEFTKVGKNFDIQINNNIDFNDIPPFFKDTIANSYREKKSLSYRKTDIYDQVYTEKKYVYKKLLKKINEKHKFDKEIISSDFLKITEILHETNALSGLKSINSIHMCNSTDYINAIDLYIENKKNKKIKWESNKHIDMTNENINRILDKEQYKNINLVSIDCCNMSNKDNDNLHQINFCAVISALNVLNAKGNCIIKINLPITNNQDIFLQYLLYTSFKKIKWYKPNIEQHHLACYVVGLEYDPTQYEKISNKLIEMCKNYKTKGLTKLEDMNSFFTIQLNSAQNRMVNITNRFIRNKIYMIDNFDKIMNKDKKDIETLLEVQVKEWVNRYLI